MLFLLLQNANLKCKIYAVSILTNVVLHITMYTKICNTEWYCISWLHRLIHVTAWIKMYWKLNRLNEFFLIESECSLMKIVHNYNITCFTRHQWITIPRDWYKHCIIITSSTSHEGYVTTLTCVTLYHTKGRYFEKTSVWKTQNLVGIPVASYVALSLHWVLADIV